MRSEHSQKVAVYRCKDCSSTTVSYRAICQNCSSKNIESVKLDGRGRIFAYTIIRVAPEQFKTQEPYAVGIVKLDSGQLVSGRLIAQNLEILENGMKVVLENVDDAGFWFRV
ncbi:MAG: hypothetical protein FJ358_05655 [Thaumarchaeota archaeon]|nr:hypothetical protein [Nitrososphaerota archaeon]